MPFRDGDRWNCGTLVDAVGMVEQFTAGMDFEAFREDPKTVAAVERRLQIVSEAAIRLGNEAEERVPDLAWRDIRGIGNRLRHQCERIELEAIWKFVMDDLAQLKARGLRALVPPC